MTQFFSQVLPSSGGRVGVTPLEGDAGRVGLGPRGGEGVVVDVDGVDAPGTLGRVAGPVAGAARHLEDAPAREEGGQPRADPGQVILPARLS